MLIILFKKIIRDAVWHLDYTKRYSDIQQQILMKNHNCIETQSIKSDFKIKKIFMCVISLNIYLMTFT